MVETMVSPPEIRGVLEFDRYFFLGVFAKNTFYLSFGGLDVGWVWYIYLDE